VFKRKRWYYIILDEAQNIKNFKSKRWQMLLNFKAKRKLLLTGTPLQNDIMEIWSYMHFLMQLIQSLHSILRPFLLRRLKKDVEKQLPEKIEHVIYCDLTRRQRFLYDEFINSDKTQDTLKKSRYIII
jgi:SNF2 family DNA or RNA helicase